jgi:hypothetical protein
MTDEQLTKLAYAALVADRTAQKPIEYTTWQALAPDEQRRYQEIAKAVIREYQFILQSGELG